MGKSARFLLLSLAGLLAVGLILGRQPLYAAIQRNRAALDTLHVVMGASEPDDLAPRVDRLAVGDCRLALFQATLAGVRQDADRQRQGWIEALACSPDYVPVIEMLARWDEPLAETATQLQPESARAWFWLAEIVSRDRPEVAIEQYRHALALDPSYGWGWVKLGRLLVERDPRAAIAAFEKACFRDDPGRHGCYGAATTAEAIGDYDTAIRFYQLSVIDKAKRRLNQLQQTLTPTPTVK